MRNLFSEHPNSVGLNYFQHLGHGLMSSFKMISIGLAVFIHAIFPFIFIHTASNFIFKSAKRLEARKTKSFT